MLRKIPRKGFAIDVLTLMTGTTIAQAIPLALSPVITRIYSPADLGALALYMSVVSIISNIVTLKYELAIILPEKDEDSASLVVVSLMLSLVISLVFFICILIFGNRIFALFGEKATNIKYWLYLTPLSILFIGIYNSFNYWSNRKLHYKRLAISRIFQSSGMTGTQICVGIFKQEALGLFVGDIVGRLSSIFVLMRQILKEDKHYFIKVSKKSCKDQMVRYKNFPKLSVPADSINVITNQLPVFFIGKNFGSNILGNYSLTDRVLSSPISLIGRAVLDVFKQKASSDFIKYGNCTEVFKKTLKMLVLIAIVPSLLIFFVLPHLFAIIFGSEWRLAGEFARIMSLLFFFRFTVSPLSYVLYIAEKQIYDLFWQIGLFAVTLASFIIGKHMNNVKIALTCFSISYSAMYIIYLGISFKFAHGIKK
jgi:O-antigen/teichoic acid export membrane protein